MSSIEELVIGEPAIRLEDHGDTSVSDGEPSTPATRDTSELDVVYIVRTGDNNEELRYSLRSLEAHFPHARVWMVGHVPQWVRNVKRIVTRQVGSKYTNSTRNVLAACERSDVSDDFVLFNDDYFVMRPIDGLEPLHRGELWRVRDYYARIASTPYLAGLVRTGTLLEELTGTPFDELLSYELHAPMAINKTRMAEALELALPRRIPALHKRTLYGNLFKVGGRRVVDCKVLSRNQPMPPRATFISTEDRTFRDGVAARTIRQRFDTPSSYEEA